MTGSTTAALLTLTASKKFAEKLSEDIYNTLKDTLKDSIKTRQINKTKSALHNKLKTIRQVKTLWQVDKPIDLNKFYCYQHILHEDRRTKITDISSLPKEENVLIHGIAGQGKSILMRFLAAQEIQTGNRIPIFIELRKVSKEKNILFHCKEFLEYLGFEQIDHSTIKKLNDQKQLAIFLDGFDEVSTQIRSHILYEIEGLIQKYDSTQFIISSRPDSGIENSFLLTNVKLDNLKNNEFMTVIYTLCNNSQFGDELIEKISNSGKELKSLLLTPLMVTLMVITYKTFQSIPDNLSEFYEYLMDAVLTRHDGSKPGFTRDKKCKLSDSDYKKLFSCFSFQCKSNFINSFTPKEFLKFAEKSISRLKYKTTPHNFLYDTYNNTCLCVKDGVECRFIHKSIQEYFCASYIASQPETVLDLFFKDLIRQQKIGHFRQEFIYLEEIDHFRFLKYFKLPFLNTITSNVISVNEKQITFKHELIEIIINGLYLHCSIVFNNSPKKELINYRMAFNSEGAFYYEMIKNTEALSLWHNTVDSKKLIDFAKKHEDRNKHLLIPLADLHKAGFFEQETKKYCEAIIRAALSQSKDAQAAIDHESNNNLMLDLEI